MSATEQDLLARVEEVGARLEALRDPDAHAAAEELVDALGQLYGEALVRVLEAVDDQTRLALAADGVVGSLMLMHGLHPAQDQIESDESEHCELCPKSLDIPHRHLLHLDERRIVCVCATCWAHHSGDPEYRPPGVRWLLLEDLGADWDELGIPIGLAMLLRSSVAGGVVAFFPSPAGATEAELDPVAWGRIEAEHPSLRDLEPDCEALLVDRTGEEPRVALVPVDEAYRLVGLVRARWEGVTGGRGTATAIDECFARVRARATAR